MKKLCVWGLILTLSISPLFKGLFFPLEASLFLAVIALFAVLYFLAKLSLKEHLYFNPWLTIPAALLIVAYGLSFISAVNMRENIEAIIQYTEYFVVFVILYDYFRDKKESLGAFLMVPTILSGFTAAVIGLEALTKAFPLLNDTLHEDRVGSTFQYYNASVIYFIICLIFTLTLMNTLKSRILILFLSGAANTLLLATLLTGSKGGYLVGGAALILVFILQPKGHRIRTFGYLLAAGLPAVLCMSKVQKLTGSLDYVSLTRWVVISFVMTLLLAFVFECLRRALAGKKIRPLLVIMLAVLAIILALLSLFVFRDKILSLIPQNILERWENFNFDNTSFRYRLDFDKDALKLIQNYGLLGLGGGGWTALYQSVQTWFYTAKAVHNHYFQVFVEAGILGFISFFTLVSIGIWFLIRSRYKTNVTWNKVQITGVLCAFLALSTHSVMDFELSYPSIALIFWAMLSYAAIQHTSGKEEKQPARAEPPKARHSLSVLSLVLVCSCLFSVNTLYSMAAYHAHKGQSALENKRYENARVYYEEALRLDPINSGYTFQLTKLYNFFAENHSNQETSAQWRRGALELAKRSVNLNPYYPTYHEILTKTYFNSGMPIEALKSAQDLITYQPCNSINYELLSKAYLESGKYYLSQNSIDEGKAHLRDCAHVESMPYASKHRLTNYTKEALSLMAEVE